MLNIESLINTLDRVANRFNNLKSKFDIFADSLEKNLMDPKFQVLGITVTHLKNSNLLILGLADKRIYVIFTTIFDEERNQNGRINSYLKVEFPDEIYLKFNEFDFDGHGLTNHDVPEGYDQVSITNDLNAIQIALNIINESLSNNIGN